MKAFWRWWQGRILFMFCGLLCLSRLLGFFRLFVNRGDGLDHKPDNDDEHFN